MTKKKPTLLDPNDIVLHKDENGDVRGVPAIEAFPEMFEESKVEIRIQRPPRIPRD